MRKLGMIGLIVAIVVAMGTIIGAQLSVAEDKAPRLCRNLRSNGLAIDEGPQWEEVVGPVVMIAEVELLVTPGNGDRHP